MNDDTIGVSTFLPEIAAEVLVKAHEACMSLPAGARRQKRLQQAIDKVKMMCPSKFRDELAEQEDAEAEGRDE